MHTRTFAVRSALAGAVAIGTVLTAFPATAADSAPPATSAAEQAPDTLTSTTDAAQGDNAGPSNDAAQGDDSALDSLPDAMSADSADTSEPAKPTVKPGEGIDAGDTAYVAVPVATLWKSPSSPRTIDKPALGNPVDLEAWSKALKTTQQRRGLTGRTETQALYGDAVTVLETRGTWAKVGVTREPAPGAEHGYAAWVPKAQIVENAPYADQLSSAAVATVTAKTTRLRPEPGKKDDSGIAVPLNTELPALAGADDEVRVGLPDGSKAWVKNEDVDVRTQGEPVAEPTPQDLVDTAKQFTGLKYVWGGTSAYGFDCSGFTYSVYRAHGIEIPRDAAPQSTAGHRVPSSDLEPGDLLFFAGNGGHGKVHHVGMYIGDGKMIHAPNASETVKVSDWRAWDSRDQFVGARRYL